MLSKEEIEKDIKTLKYISECFTYSMWSEDTEALRRVLQYIDQLESDKQKLIEKLEEINTRNAELYNSPKQKEVDFSEWNLAQELLEILKKE